MEISILDIIYTALFCLFGFVSIVIKTKTNLLQKVSECISCAESAFLTQKNLVY